MIPYCVGSNSVCRGLSKLLDLSQIIVEPGFCKCSNCFGNWTTENPSRSTITCHHHEFPDRMIQYKFCSEVLSKVTCSAKEKLALVLAANKQGEYWLPYLRESKCSCPSTYFMTVSYPNPQRF